jgi:para-nitrobenzyl esterase
MRLYPVSRYPSPSPFIAYRTVMADAFSVCPTPQTEATITSEHHCGYWDAVNRSAPWAGG